MTIFSSGRKGFVWVLLAVIAGFLGQLLLSMDYVYLAIVLIAFSSLWFIFVLRNHSGPNIVLTLTPLIPKNQDVLRFNFFQFFLQAKSGMQYPTLPGVIQHIFRASLIWIRQQRLLVGVLALAVGVGGQFFLSLGQIQTGTISIGLATSLFILAFRKQPGLDTKLTADGLNQQPSFDPKWLARARISLGLAIFFACLAFWLFGTSMPAIFPWLLHFVSIFLLILSSYWMIIPRTSAEIQQNKSNKTDMLNGAEIVLFVAILILAAFMRLFRFDQIPFGLWYDEANHGLYALKILNESGYLPTFVEATSLPAHFLYLMAFFFRVFGVSIISLRIVSVIFGLWTVVAAFFLGKVLFNKKFGLILAFFLAISRWDVNWSRIGMHPVSVPFFEITSVILILQALRKQRLVDYSLVGLSLGMGLCFYTPFLFFPVVICVFLVFAFFMKPGLWRSSWRGCLLLVLGIFIASVPISQYAIRQPDSFFERMRLISIFNGKSPQEGWEAVAETTREHLLMFNYQGDNNGRHNLPGEPMLDPITGALMVLGVGLSLWRIRQPGSFLLVAWLLLMLAPGIFSLDFESPQSLRAIGSLPAAYLLAVVPIHALWQEWEQTNGKRPAVIFILPLILVLIGVGYYNYHVYFNLQALDSDTWRVFSTPETIIGKRLAELGPEVDTYVSTFYNNTPTIQFLAPEITRSQPLETYQSLPIPSDGQRPVVLFVDEERKQFFLQAQHYYPNADFKEYKTPKGEVVLYQVTLKPADIVAAQGITASYYRNANWSEEPFLVRKEKTIAMDWKDGQPAQFPFGVKWQGVLYAEKYGFYQLSLHSPTPAELTLDGKQIQLVGTDVQTAQVELARGSHELVIKAQGKEGRFELDWQPPEEDLAPVPYQNLFVAPISNNGLLGKYFANGDWQDPPAFTQVDPWIHFYFHNQPLPRPYTVEWTGRINISAGGHYRFALESIDESELFIDEAKVVSAKPNEKQAGELDLSPGFHTLRLRFADRTGYTHINLYWTPPDAEEESIPQEALFLP